MVSVFSMRAFLNYGLYIVFLDIMLLLRICLPMQETQAWSLSQEDPLEKEMQPATYSSIPV